MYGHFARFSWEENVYRKIQFTNHVVRTQIFKQLKNMSIEIKPELTPTHNHTVTEAYRTCPFTTCEIARELLTLVDESNDFYIKIGKKIKSKLIELGRKFRKDNPEI